MELIPGLLKYHIEFHIYHVRANSIVDRHSWHTTSLCLNLLAPAEETLALHHQVRREETKMLYRVTVLICHTQSII
jgi:hypothetical protein